MFRHLLAPSLACFAVIGAGTAAADAVVMASTASDYGIGRVVADGEAVILPEGAGIHLLEASGRVVSLTGPFEGPLDAAPRDRAPAAAAALWTGGSFSQTDLGAARSLAPPDTVRDVLTAGPRRPGRHCILDPDGGKEAPEVSAGGRAPGGVEIRRIAVPPDDAAALAIGLAREGCSAQLAPLLARLRDAVVPIELALASDRGAYPTYRRGEPVRLTLRTSRDAHLHCRIRDGRGTTVPIFPSRASGGSRLEAGAALTFPGERMPLPLHADGQTVQCFAGERDLSADLQAIGQDFGALGPDDLARIERVLDRDAGALATAHIVLRTE